MRWIGPGYRFPLHDWVADGPQGVSCLEVTAEHFFDRDTRPIRQLAERYPIFVHGLGLSLGTPGPLDRVTLTQFARVADAVDATWVSEHISFTRTSEVDLGHLNPVPRTRNSLAVMVDHAREMADFCRRPLILENITFDLNLPGELSEPEFLNELCDAAGCGLLLDVTNLYINAHNHNFEPLAWLHEIDPRYITQLHIVGYNRRGDRLHDSHSEPIQPDLLELLQAVVDYAPVKAIILERDDNQLDPMAIADEIQKLQTFADLSPDS